LIRKSTLNHLASLQNAAASVTTTSQIQEPMSWLQFWQWTKTFRN